MKRLSPDQIRRIEEIKKEWFKELDELPEIKLAPNTLSNASNLPRIKLAEKYQPRIKAIYDEAIYNW